MLAPLFRDRVAIEAVFDKPRYLAGDVLRCIVEIRAATRPVFVEYLTAQVLGAVTRGQLLPPDQVTDRSSAESSTAAANGINSERDIWLAREQCFAAEQLSTTAEELAAAQGGKALATSTETSLSKGRDKQPKAQVTQAETHRDTDHHSVKLGDAVRSNIGEKILNGLPAITFTPVLNPTSYIMLLSSPVIILQGVTLMPSRCYFYTIDFRLPMRLPPTFIGKLAAFNYSIAFATLYRDNMSTTEAWPPLRVALPFTIAGCPLCSGSPRVSARSHRTPVLDWSLRDILHRTPNLRVELKLPQGVKWFDCAGRCTPAPNGMRMSRFGLVGLNQAPLTRRLIPQCAELEGELAAHLLQEKTTVEPAEIAERVLQALECLNPPSPRGGGSALSAEDKLLSRNFWGVEAIAEEEEEVTVKLEAYRVLLSDKSPIATVSVSGDAPYAGVGADGTLVVSTQQTLLLTIDMRESVYPVVEVTATIVQHEIGKKAKSWDFTNFFGQHLRFGIATGGAGDIHPAPQPAAPPHVTTTSIVAEVQSVCAFQSVHNFSITIPAKTVPSFTSDIGVDVEHTLVVAFCLVKPAQSTSPTKQPSVLADSSHRTRGQSLMVLQSQFSRENLLQVSYTAALQIRPNLHPPQQMNSFTYELPPVKLHPTALLLDNSHQFRRCHRALLL